MILSDRDLRALIEQGSLVIEPFDPDSVQPSSIDLRVGSQFRVFANNRYPYIDVRQPMEGLTEMVEVSEDEPFILHPGEFVLGSTLERVALPHDKVGRLEGKSSLGRLGLLIHSSLPAGEEILFRDTEGVVEWRPIEAIVRKELEGEVVGFDPDSFQVDYHRVTGWYEGPPDQIYEVVLASGRSVRVTAGHNLFTLDEDGELAKVRTGELEPGVMVAIPGTIPAGATDAPVLDLLSMAAPSDLERLVLEGEPVAEAFEAAHSRIGQLFKDFGIGHVGYYRSRSRMPAPIGLQIVDRDAPGLGVSVRGSVRSLPNEIVVDSDLAWLLGLYVAEGYRRSKQVVWSNTDQGILDRVESILGSHGLPVYRAEGSSITCSSSLLSLIIGWLGAQGGSLERRIPPVVYGWPDELIGSFLEGFIDGDGSREETRVSLWTGSDKLATDFLALLPRLGKRAAICSQERSTSRLFQISIPENEHKLLTSVPLADRLLVAIREQVGWTQVHAARQIGFTHPTDLCNIEKRSGRDAVRLRTLRRILVAYADHADSDELSRLRRLTEGDLRWDRVSEVRKMGELEPIFDLEVRPDGRRIENFLAGRGGLFVSNTAGFVDAGFDGYLTLELSNVANLPITLYPGMKIGQLCLFDMSSPAERPYGSEELGSKYHGQVGPTPSRYFENFEDP